MFPLLGVLLSFLIILGLRARDVDFSVALLAASAVLGVTSGKPLGIFIDVAVRTFADPATLNLCAAVALITVLGYVLKETGLMAEMIEGLKGLLPSRVLLSLIPALFGLLSMPGGALMSAPFNEPEAERLGLRPEHKTYINVWFRHLWYWASPISPVPILAAGLAGFTLREFLGAQLPLFAVTVAIGFIVSMGFIKRGGDGAAETNSRGDAVRGLSPIVATVALAVVGVPIWAALVVGIAMAFALKRVPPGRALGLVRRGVRWDVVASVAAMLFFRYMIIATGSVNSLLLAITGAGVPLLALLVAVPLLIGVLSGTPTMGIGIVFPLLLPLCGAFGVHLVSVIYAGVIAGYLGSPLHLCLVLTNSYYKSELGKVYVYLLPSVAALYLVAVIYHLAMNGL
ncbi:hypothetical protein DRO42_00470 [Candidatus Bathyarchaeota archaeon]|nr:MAG: hypothetical protein DRO42_00470 [Candidatus Bathyarchaeota archaeon]